MLNTITNSEITKILRYMLKNNLKENQVHALQFKLHRFAGELESSHEVITEILPDRDAVEVIRIEEKDFNGNNGNLIDYDEAYIALSAKPFSITFCRFVDAGEGEDEVWTLNSVEA